MIVPTVLALLAASDKVTSVVGGRIYPVLIPQEVQRDPCIVVWLGGNDPSNTNPGTSAVDNLNFMVHVDSKTYGQLDVLCMEIRKSLQRYQGSVLNKIMYVTENDNEYDPENKMFSRVMVFNVRSNR